MKDPNDYSVGINEWASIMNSFGLGKFMGTDLPVGSKGLIPTAEFYDNRFGEGVGILIVLSLMVWDKEILIQLRCKWQIIRRLLLTKVFSFTPHIVHSIDGKPLTDSTYMVKKIHWLIQNILTSFNAECVMYLQWVLVVVSKLVVFTQAGKTGNSQNSHGQDHSLFVLFAPADKPKIAIAAIVEWFLGTTLLDQWRV